MKNLKSNTFNLPFYGRFFIKLKINIILLILFIIYFININNLVNAKIEIAQIYQTTHSNRPLTSPSPLESPYISPGRYFYGGFASNYDDYYFQNRYSFDNEINNYELKTIQDINTIKPYYFLQLGFKGTILLIIIILLIGGMVGVILYKVVGNKKYD